MFQSLFDSAAGRSLEIMFLLLPFAPIPYVIWILYSAYTREWRRALTLIAIPSILCLLLGGTIYVYKSWRNADDLAKAYGGKVSLGAPIFDSPWEMTDWYACTVWELPPGLRKRFEAPDAKLLTEHPQPPYHFRWWKTKPWRETPVEEKLQLQVNDMLGKYSQRRRPGLNEQLAAVREALNRKGTYYGLILEYAPPAEGTEVTCAELYVVDLTGNRLYAIRATPP